MMKKLYPKYKHILLPIGFMTIYFAWFSYLEKTVTKGYHVIHMAIDNHIPFCEFFIIPYFLWFFYVAAVVFFFCFQNKENFYKTCAFLFTGMALFLIISTLYPNGHHLRPLEMPRDNFFTQMVAILYRADTPTNLFPSIHVYNSLGAHFAIINSEYFSRKKGIRTASFFLSSSIILSTLFLKQHSMFDVLTAFGLAAVMYALVYRGDILMVFRRVLSPAKQQEKAGY